MSSKIILFAGAPDPSTFDQDILNPLTTFTEPISTFLGEPAQHTASPETQVAWRSLPLKRRRLEAGLSQLYAFPDVLPGHDFQPHDNFFTTASLSFDSTGHGTRQDATSQFRSQSQENQEILSQFYDQSLARHQDIHSSQLPGPDDNNLTSFEADGTTSFLTTSKSFNTTTEGDISALSVRPPLAGSAHLSDLEDIPSTKDLLALAPATVTVNLIAGIISISQPREVKTRWGKNMSLVELLLGDETRSGFSVTFWLPLSENDGVRRVQQDAHQELLSNLWRQDVVMLQNVALHVFRGKVYGQSLRKNLTRVHLLHRRRLDERDEGGYYRLEHLKSKKTSLDPQLDKTRKVREWVLHFVGGGNVAAPAARKGASSTTRVAWDLPPEDTQ